MKGENRAVTGMAVEKLCFYFEGLLHCLTLLCNTLML